MDSGPSLEKMRLQAAANQRMKQERLRLRGGGSAGRRSASPEETSARGASCSASGPAHEAPGMTSPVGNMETPAVPMSQLRLLFGARNKSSPRELAEQVWVCSHCETRNPPSKSVLKRCTNCNKKSSHTFASSTPRGQKSPYPNNSGSGQAGSGRTSYRALDSRPDGSLHSSLPLVSSPSQLGLTPGPRKKPAVPSFGNTKTSSASSARSMDSRRDQVSSRGMQGLRSSLKPAKRRHVSSSKSSQPRVKFANMSRSRKVTQISSFAQITSPHAVTSSMRRLRTASHNSGDKKPQQRSHAASQLSKVGTSPVWMRLWPQLEKMGWSMHETRRKIIYLRPNAKVTLARLGEDKYESRSDLLNSLTDEEFSRASKLAEKSRCESPTVNNGVDGARDSEISEHDEEETGEEDSSARSTDCETDETSDSSDGDEDEEDDYDGSESSNEEESECIDEFDSKWKVFDDLLQKHGADIEQIGWPQLEEAGWLYSKSHKLYNVLYVAPGFTHKTAKIEETMFEDVYDLQDKLRERKKNLRKQTSRNKVEIKDDAKDARGGSDRDVIEEDSDDEEDEDRDDLKDSDSDVGSPIFKSRNKTARQPITPHGVSSSPRSDNYKAIDEALDVIGTNLDAQPLDIFRQDLKPLGWKYVNGDLLHNFYYLAPGVTKKTGTMGLTKFPRLGAVIDALKLRRNQLKRSRTARRQRKSSREYLAAAAAAASAIHNAVSDSDSDSDMAGSTKAISEMRAHRASAAVALAAVDKALECASDDDEDAGGIDKDGNCAGSSDGDSDSNDGSEKEKGNKVVTLAPFVSPKGAARGTRQRNRMARSGASSSSKKKKNSLDLVYYHPSFCDAVAKVQDLSTTNKVWKALKKIGWKYVSMGGIMGCMYLCPNVSKKDGKLNFSMFEDLNDVIKVIEHNQDLEANEEDDEGNEQNEVRQMEQERSDDVSSNRFERYHPSFRDAMNQIFNLNNPWPELQSLGWKYKMGPLSVGGNMAYFAPGAQKASARLGFDVFTDLEQIRQIMYRLGWQSDNSSDEDDENEDEQLNDEEESGIAHSSRSKVPVNTATFKSPLGAARGTRNRRKAHGITASTKKALRVYSPASEDGCSGVNNDISKYHPSFAEAVEKVYNLDQPWPELQNLGWKYKPGPMAVGGNMAYFAPGAKKSSAVLGYDMFTDLEFIRQIMLDMGWQVDSSDENSSSEDESEDDNEGEVGVKADSSKQE
eukprot:g71.t1